MLTPETGHVAQPLIVPAEEHEPSTSSVVLSAKADVIAAARAGAASARPDRNELTRAASATPTRSGAPPSQPPGSNYRPSSQQSGIPGATMSSSSASAGMYYASAGVGAGTGAGGQGSASTGAGAGSIGGPASGQGNAAGSTGSRNAGAQGAYATAGSNAGSMRGGPPGFGGRGADPNDFPALGSSSQQSAASIQQQLFMQSAQTPGGGNMVPPPPPPPGLAGPATPQSSMGGNGLDDFPALGSENKDARMANYLRSGQAPPSPPNSHPNGTSASHSSAGATPLTQPPVPNQSMSMANMQGLTSPSSRRSNLAQARTAEEVPIMRPVQQILSSPVDKWGLQALLYEIKMGHSGDRGLMLFGEDLSELGVDVTQDDPLYKTFTTPWLEPSQIPQSQIFQEPYHTPPVYDFPAPILSQAKLANFTEETLFLAFYSAPGDVIQLEVASELYNRGWRFHMELHVWLLAPTAGGNQDAGAAGSFSPGGTPSGPEGQSQSQSQSQSGGLLRGPFLVYDPATFEKTRTSDDFAVLASSLEETKPAAMYIAEESARREKLAAAQGQQQQQQHLS